MAHRRRFIEEVVLWIAPSADEEWISAMISERSYAPSADAGWIWLLGCFQAAFLFRLRDRWSRFAEASFVLTAVMIGFDWGVNCTALSVALICMSSLTLALLWPVRAVTAGLFGGATLPVAHGIADFWQPLWPRYQFKPLDAFDWLTLLAVLLLSIVWAIIGVRLRRSLSPLSYQLG